MSAERIRLAETSPADRELIDKAATGYPTADIERVVRALARHARDTDRRFAMLEPVQPPPQPSGALPDVSNEALAEWVRATAGYNRGRVLDAHDARLLNVVADRLLALSPEAEPPQPQPDGRIPERELRGATPAWPKP